MIGKFKNGKLIKCPKCKGEHLEEIDHCFEVDERKANVVYDVMCNECKHEFEITDVFIYQYSDGEL